MRFKCSAAVFAALAPVMFAVGCSGSTPPVETVTVSNIAMAIEGSVVKLSVTATSTTIGPIPANSFSWIVNGSPYNGQVITPSVAPGNISYCVTAVGADTTGRLCDSGQVPGFAGRIREFDFARDDLPAKGLFILFSKGADTARVDVANDGTFDGISTLASKDSVSCMVDAVNTSNRVYHPIKKCVVAKAGDKIVKTVYPFTLTMPASCGVYAGRVMPFSISKAYGTTDFFSSFYPLVVFTDGTRYNYDKRSQETLPVPVAFWQDAGDAPVTESEKTTALGIINTLSSYLCGTYFRPAESGEVSDTNGVHIHVRPPGAFGEVEWKPRPHTEMGGCKAVFSTSANMLEFNGARLLHSLVHCLGFNHTANWTGIMGRLGGGGIDLIPSAEDALYILVFYRTAEFERKDGTSCSIVESHEGERELMLGLPARNAVCFPP